MWALRLHAFMQWTQGAVTHRGTSQTSSTWEATHSCLSLEEVKKGEMGSL